MFLLLFSFFAWAHNAAFEVGDSIFFFHAGMHVEYKKGASQAVEDTQRRQIFSLFRVWSGTGQELSPLSISTSKQWSFSYPMLAVLYTMPKKRN